MKLIEKKSKNKDITQGCTCQKYNLEIYFFIFKNKFHPYKKLKK